LGFQFSYAYQPIVDLSKHQIFAHEALVRGPNGESAASVLSRVNAHNRYRFDQACRVKAIKTAAALDMQTKLSINFMPNAIYRPEVCIRTTLEAARHHGFPIERIIFETVEGEEINDGKWLAEVLREYQRIGFLTAIDDFGAGFAGLNLLADFQPDLIKLDMALVRDIDRSKPRQSIVKGVARMCEELAIRVIAEGIESRDECLCLQGMGIDLMQGYLFAKPAFESCVVVGDALHWQAT
jgi:EAL domain-containing protein (putative c-di-GMP-specific phosphodiesterase class I)